MPDCHGKACSAGEVYLARTVMSSAMVERSERCLRPCRTHARVREGATMDVARSVRISVHTCRHAQQVDSSSNVIQV